MIHNRPLLYTFIIIIFIATCTQAQSAECVFWDGHSEKGTVSYQKGAIKLQSKSGNKNIKIADLLEIRFASDAYDNKDIQRVFLKSGSILSVKLGASNDFKEISAQSPNNKKFKFPGELISAIEFSDLMPGAHVDSTPSGAHSISRNGKVVSCAIEWMTKRDISIKTKAGRIKLKRNKLHRVVLADADTGTNPLQKGNDIILRTKFNDKIYAKLLTLSDTEIKIKTSIGTMEFPIRDIVSIGSISDRIVNLTDKKPQKIVETPYIDFIRTHKINSNLFGAPIVMDGVRYESGIAMHSRSTITYQLNGAYTALVTYYGIDTSVTNKGNADFIIRSGDKELLRKTVNGTDPLQYIHLDLNGLTSLELTIDYGTNGSGGDHAIWALPRLIK